MSFLDDIIDTGKSLVGGIFGGGGSSGGGSILGSLISTAITGFALSKVSQSMNPTNDTPAVQAATPDYGVRLQVAPDANQRIPVLYGSAVFGGNIIDAVLSDNNKSMYFVIALCEKTGTLLSDDSDSVFTFKNVYWNDNRVVFQDDGITAAYTQDRDGNVDSNIAGLVQIYCFDGGSDYPVSPYRFSSSSLQPAYSIVPGWTNAHTMSDLVFAVVKITYSSDKGVNGIPTMTFNIANSMTLPGDCLYDYMTNDRYGANIAAEEIFGE
jgi:hypothetical protein